MLTASMANLHLLIMLRHHVRRVKYLVRQLSNIAERCLTSLQVRAITISRESMREARLERAMVSSGGKVDGDDDAQQGYISQRSDQEDVFIAQLYRRARLLNSSFQMQVHATQA